MALLFIGTTELLLICALALLLFGGKKLPELMRGLGKGVREFKEGMEDNSGSSSDSKKEENFAQHEKEQHDGVVDRDEKEG